MRGVLRLLTGFLLFLPASAWAQNPGDPTHPALPWALGRAIPTGQLLNYQTYQPQQYVRDVWVPAQPVVVEAVIGLQAQAREPESSPPRQPQVGEAPDSGSVPASPQSLVLRQTYVVPGYYVRETTVGFHYPERWVLDSSYTWRLLPAEFRFR